MTNNSEIVDNNNVLKKREKPTKIQIAAVKLIVKRVKEGKSKINLTPRILFLAKVHPRMCGEYSK